MASTAWSATGGNFLLGKANVATALTKLTGNVNGAAMQVTNPNSGTNDTALDLRVQAGEAPIRVNSPTRVTNLNADKVDGQDSTALLPGGDLPSGRTVRGHYDIRGYATPSTFGWNSSAISFGYRLASNPTVRIIKVGATAPAECPGSESSPEAAPGYLCVYEKGAGNLFDSTYPTTTNVSRDGAGLYAFSRHNSNTFAAQFSTWGTWAVTGT